MGKITSIQVQKNDPERCNIFIDGEFKLGLSIDLVWEYRLKEGEELGEERINAFKEEDEKKVAYKKAIDYVLKVLKTKRQVKDYLVKKGYSEPVAYWCVDKLKDYGYIDDVEYSKRYIESNYKTQGKKLIEYKLMGKGIKKQDILSAYEQVEVSFNESAKAVALKHIKGKERTRENLAKTYRYLLGRGFSNDDVSSAISSLREDD